MLIRAAEQAGRRVDVRCENGRVVALGPKLAPVGEEAILEAEGGALLPGLHDHHLHLYAFAASLTGAICGPPRVRSAAELAAALAAAPVVAGWRRGTGYFESVAGPLDRTRLDALSTGGPLRIQHRSGILWFLNSAAIEALGLDAARSPALDLPGVERDGAGRATGRLFRADAWLRDRLPATPLPDLRAASAWLAGRGITSVTDATVSNDLAQAERIAFAQQRGELAQRVVLMGDASLDRLVETERLVRGPRKFLLDEPALPDFELLVAEIRAAHRAGRGAAFHCVTRSEIHFALAALEAAGSGPADRLEHASIAPIEAVEAARRLGVRVVTQPGFVFERGDDYLAEVDPRDRPELYGLRRWLDAAVPLSGASDAPYGCPDPWLAMHAAVTRRTRSGRSLGPREAVSAEQALALFAGDHGAGDRSPAPAVGDPADLCLLDRSWQEACAWLADPDALPEQLAARLVRATLCAGVLVGTDVPHGRTTVAGDRTAGPAGSAT